MTASAPDATERLRAELAARGFELLEAPAAFATRGAATAGTGTSLVVSAACRHNVDEPGYGELGVMIPVQLRLNLAADGHIEQVHGGTPDAADVQAAVTWLGDLVASGRLDDSGRGIRRRGATHCVVTDAQGRRTVRRKGFDSAAPATA